MLSLLAIQQININSLLDAYSSDYVKTLNGVM